MSCKLFYGVFCDPVFEEFLGRFHSLVLAWGCKLALRVDSRGRSASRFSLTLSGSLWSHLCDRMAPIF